MVEIFLYHFIYILQQTTVQLKSIYALYMQLFVNLERLCTKFILSLKLCFATYMKTIISFRVWLFAIKMQFFDCNFVCFCINIYFDNLLKSDEESNGIFLFQVELSQHTYYKFYIHKTNLYRLFFLFLSTYITIYTHNPHT